MVRSSYPSYHHHVISFPGGGGDVKTNPFPVDEKTNQKQDDRH